MINNKKNSAFVYVVCVKKEQIKKPNKQNLLEKL